MTVSNEYKDLYGAAFRAAKNAYAPYSKFSVGAALLLSDGSVVCGVNVENRSYGAGCCAERSAVFAAVSSGRRDFAAIAIAAPGASYPVAPCGICRQVLSEFAGEDFPVIFGSSSDNVVETTLGALYPFDSLHELKDGD